MTSEQRRTHIRKRKERAIMARTKPRSKYVFSNRKSRPVLRHMSALHRRSYLKNLIKFAEMSVCAYQTVPFDKQKFAELAPNKVKSALRASKNARKKGSVYKNLTYTSLIPKAARLTVEVVHVKS